MMIENACINQNFLNLSSKEALFNNLRATGYIFSILRLFYPVGQETLMPNLRRLSCNVPPDEGSLYRQLKSRITTFYLIITAFYLVITYFYLVFTTQYLVIMTQLSRNNDFLSHNYDFLSRNYLFFQSRNYDFLLFLYSLYLTLLGFRRICCGTEILIYRQCQSLINSSLRKKTPTNYLTFINFLSVILLLFVGRSNIHIYFLL